MSEKRKGGAPKGNKNALGNRGGGGPSSFRPEYVEQARIACDAGLTDKELAEQLGVCERTIRTWKHEHLEFAAALKAGKEVADDRVERSLYARALGYEHEEVDIRVVDKEIVKTQIRRYYPPDTTACIFWLKNRRRDLWRDKIETGITDKDGNDVAPPDPLELARRAAFLLLGADKK